MSIDQIKYFYNIAKYKNITKVAKDLHISQPALSQQIQKFENILGHKLFERSNKGAELTEINEIVFKHSKSIIDIYSKMLEELDHKTSNIQTVRIEACCSLDDYFLTQILCDSSLNTQSIRYKLYSEQPEVILEHLKTGVCDIGFMCEKFLDKDYMCKEVGIIEFILFAHKDYPIPDEIELKSLSNYTFITMNENYEFRIKLFQKLDSLGFDSRKLKVKLELGSFESVKKAVNSSLGIAYLPDIAFNEQDFSTLKIVKVKSIRITQNFNIIYKKLPVYSAVPKFVKFFDDKMLSE